MINKLKEIEKSDKLIDEKTKEINRLKVLATKVNHCSSGERVQASAAGDKIPEYVSEIVDLQNEIKDELKKLVKLKKECKNYIDSLNDPLLIGILYKRYFEYKTWEKIAEELNRSRQWITKKHQKFVESLK